MTNKENCIHYLKIFIESFNLNEKEKLNILVEVLTDFYMKTDMDANQFFDLFNEMFNRKYCNTKEKYEK